MSNVQNERIKDYQDYALEAASLKFASFLGIDHAPIVWNVNPYKVQRPEGDVPKGYPIIYLRVVAMERSEFASKRKQTNQYSYGAIAEDGVSRKALKLTPATIEFDFMLITDDPRDATGWVSKLIVYNEDFAKHSNLGFVIAPNKMGGNFKITNQLIITSERYDIQPVEYDENAPMEYNIVGTMRLITRLTTGGLDPSLIPTLAVYHNTNPSKAIVNEDDSTDGLEIDYDMSAKVFPISLRNSQGF